jgi:molybdate transport system substrate-binding protein
LVVATGATAVAETAAAETVRVFAAASLTEAFQDIASAFERARPGDRVELSFAGSQVLRTQIEQGAPADVFAGADLVHAEALRAAGLLGPIRVFARNALVVVVPEGGRVGRLEDLARPGVKVVVAGAAVPAGRYTSRVLGKLSAAPSFGGDFAARVRANVVSEETSVRVVLAKVVLGEVDAGFVYATDARTSAKLRVIGLPESAGAIAEYPIGVVPGTAVPATARAFVDFVLGADGRAVLRKHGFLP